MTDGHGGPDVRADPAHVAGDGLPTLPTGEPVLARWFVVLMLLLVPIGLGVTLWALLSTDRETLDAAQRRPPGTAEVTHTRGQAALATATRTAPGPGCATGVTLVGDAGARAAGRRALAAVCPLLSDDELAVLRPVLEDAADLPLRLRFAVFEVNGLDSSTRLEDGALVIELNAKFQFEDATRAAPALAHELRHLADGDFPGDPVDARAELAAIEVQAATCDLLVFRTQDPRTCLDARELLAEDDPLGALRGAGYGGR